MTRFVIVVVAAFVACSSHSTPQPVVATKHDVPPPPVVVVSNAWIEDDYTRALADAKKANAPLFVDTSAVWCHTCKAMRAFVLDDASLPKNFVRLSIDVEKDQNASAVAAFPSHVLPTFFVVDPSDGSIHGRWEGAGSIQQMRTFMNDAAQSIAMAHAGSLKPDDPLALLLAGHRATLQRDAKAAETAFARALEKAPSGWSHKVEALLGLLKAKEHTGSGCAQEAERVFSEKHLDLPSDRSSLAVDYGAEALDCVEKATDPRAHHIRQLVADYVDRLASDESTSLSPDDRADAWKVVWDAHEALGEASGAKKAAEMRLIVIQRAIEKRASEPEFTTTFDGARMETLEYLGRGEEAARFLEAQEKALPNDYNPPHRLAHVYYKLKRYDDALAAINRALPKAYGARKGLILRLKADVLIAQNKKPEARAALEEQLALYKSLPDAQKKPGFEQKVQEQIDKLK
jgi:tetratricopeptide (TPR) repeat protein